MAAAAIVAGLAFAQGSGRSVWDGVYTDEQSKRGEALYQSNCASCHGASMEGGEQAPPLTGGEFLSNWDGLTVGDIFDRMRTTMPANKPGKLSREENADVLARMLSVNRFPAGAKELDHQTELLKQIKFVANKPDSK
jgi:mono/diheme cytochrome c family protein